MWAHKEGSQPEHKAIEHGEIRRTLSGAIADQELMFEQERFSSDPARSARAEEFREGHEQMDHQEEQIAHELETILPATLHKTAPQRRFMPNLPNRRPQVRSSRSLKYLITASFPYPWWTRRTRAASCAPMTWERPAPKLPD